MVYRLSDEELIYMSALIGADNLWGLADPFQNCADAEIPFELLRIQDQLIQIGVVKATPDGYLYPSEELLGILKHCMNSEKVYVFNSSMSTSDNVQLRFFEHSGVLIRYSFRNKAELSQINRELAFQEIRALFGDAEPITETDLSLVTGVTRLRRMGSLSRQHFLFELKNCGCEDSLATLIVDGLQGKSEFCSLLAYERKGGSETLTGKLVTLRFASGNLIVTPEKGDINSVRFSRLRGDKLNSAIENIIGIYEEVSAV